MEDFQAPPDRSFNTKIFYKSAHVFSEWFVLEWLLTCSVQLKPVRNFVLTEKCCHFATKAARHMIDLHKSNCWCLLCICWCFQYSPTSHIYEAFGKNFWKKGFEEIYLSMLLRRWSTQGPPCWLCQLQSSQNCMRCWGTASKCFFFGRKPIQTQSSKCKIELIGMNQRFLGNWVLEYWCRSPASLQGECASLRPKFFKGQVWPFQCWLYTPEFLGKVLKAKAQSTTPDWARRLHCGAWWRGPAPVSIFLSKFLSLTGL